MDIKYLVIDVDGTMTDGGLYYDENGNETKKFCTKDAAGFFAAHQVGMKIMVGPRDGRKKNGNCFSKKLRISKPIIFILSNQKMISD